MIVLYFILSIWGWIWAVSFTVFYSLSGLFFVMPLTLLFNARTRHAMHLVAVIWAKSIVAFTPFWRLKVEGQENVQEAKNYVVVANHQSMLDILAALAGLPLSVHFKFMAKKELFVVPFIGWHMGFAGYIALDRNSPQSGKAALDKTREWLKKKVSVLFFPEGTRSPDGEMKRFKAGAFRAAQDTGVEVLPVVMDGTGQALPKMSFIVKRMTTMTVSIGKPVKIKPGENLEEATEKIREEMKVRLAHIRKP
jgi:1-acyl-sn-glycerol-3-phosphate acyltransferase